jgi:putative addiction module component (TIGR02574 family)
MSVDLDKVLRDALRLPPPARAALAGALLESLEGERHDDAEPAWRMEIARRLDELDRGAVEPVSADEARAAIFDAANDAKTA